MNINDMAYQLLETIRKTSVDDESIDLRLLQDFIRDQRAQDLERAFVKKRDFYRFVQTYNSDNKGKTELELITDGDINRTGVTLLKTKQKIAEPLLLNNRYAITKVSPLNFVMDNFKFVNYDEAIYTGHGKFNKFMNVAFLKDDYLYIKATANNHAKALKYIRLEGIFADPLLVPGFDEDKDDYPISNNIWNTMIEDIIKGKISIKLSSDNDIVNNATDDANA
jgi:hypothetical protein